MAARLAQDRHAGNQPGSLAAQAARLRPASLRGGALPRLWLVSDPARLPDPCAAAARLPLGAGVLARGLAPAVLARLGRIAARRGICLLVGGDARAALRARCGLHLPDRPAGPGLTAFLLARQRRVPWAMLSLAVHGHAGLSRARRVDADFGFVSPAFPTASHPGAPALGPLRWAALAARLGRPAVALGGVAPASARRLPRHGPGRVAGLAAIGALAG
ncbi:MULTISPECIES: thiamine phosphate synthase [Roseomonadaceae]|uniref:Thiamine phosphate synthase n=1 Tax=Falsiroseomonas oleicola TaxID=2801474 RepID=A0ABS6HAM5_9PROT|nr:thiamine phosphate synthase [Roseomonas oleicola]MBU8544375.1 thiamine phosphate synthase [Roseomonas oleicola]